MILGWVYNTWDPKDRRRGNWMDFMMHLVIGRGTIGGWDISVSDILSGE